MQYFLQIPAQSITGRTHHNSSMADVEFHAGEELPRFLAYSSPLRLLPTPHARLCFDRWLQKLFEPLLSPCRISRVVFRVRCLSVARKNGASPAERIRQKRNHANETQSSKTLVSNKISTWVLPPIANRRQHQLAIALLLKRLDLRSTFFGEIRPDPPCAFALLKPDNGA